MTTQSLSASLTVALFAGFSLTGCNDGPSRPKTDDSPLFREIAIEVGIDHRHDNGMSGERYIVEMMGPGGGLVDVDGDGDLDVVALQGLPLGPGRAPHADDLRAEHRIFLNQLRETGELTFSDAGDAGLASEGYAIGVVSGDFDNDGDVDLYLFAYGANRLLANRGDGTFEDVTARAGVSEEGWSAAAVFFDYDADGWLDLFVGNYLHFNWGNRQTCFNEASGRDYCGPLAYPPSPDRLFRNRGDGTFEDVTARAGLGTAIGKALGAEAFDVDLDGRLDLLVANDDMENFLWHNRGDGTFVEDGLLLGVAVNGSGGTEGSMGIALGDYDNDGDEDVLLTHLVGESNTLYRNDGGFFTDVTAPSGLASPSLPFTSFGTGFVDWNRDGWLDLVVTNGAVMTKAEQVAAGLELPLIETEQLFENRGDGTFEEVTVAGGEALLHAGVGRGAAFGDIDEDGDLDVLLTDNHGPVRLWRSESTEGGWVGLRLLTAGRDALGALAEIEIAGRRQIRRARTAGSYASASDPRLLFGLGDATSATVDVVTVHWLDGLVERWAGLSTGRYHELRQGEGEEVIR